MPMMQSANTISSIRVLSLVFMTLQLSSGENRNERQTMVAFPLIKLGTLAIKQISKPLAKFIRNRATSSRFFRTYICMPPAQMYHWVDVNIRMRMLGLSRATEVQRLNEEMAVELGAEMLGEFVIFSIAASTIYFEYQRSAVKEKLKEEAKQREVLELQQAVTELGIVTEVQAAEIRQLQRTVWDLDDRTRKLKR